MLAQSAGEDLIVSNFMVANSDTDGVFDREYFRGSPDPLSNDETILYWNQEFRSTIWGHLTLLNLKQLVEPIFTGFTHTTNPHDFPTNADIADHTHDQGGLPDTRRAAPAGRRFVEGRAVRRDPDSDAGRSAERDPEALDHHDRA